MTLETDIAGVRLRNPLVLASGILGVTKASLKFVADNGAGAVTTKSVSLEPRKGHASPIIITYEAGMLNAVGYSNPGAEEASREFAGIKDIGIPAIASVIGQTAEEFERVLEALRPAKLGFSAVEVPLSCPHTPGYGILAGQETPEFAGEAVRTARKARLPVFVKISPNVRNVRELAEAIEKAGASGITAVNTMGPGMVIDIDTGKPVLGFRFGGVSGPALRPVAVRAVYDVCESSKIPVIGTGGVTSGRDAIEMVMAGATAVGIGSAVHYRGADAFRKIAGEMEEWMERNRIRSLKEIRGIAHER